MFRKAIRWKLWSDDRRVTIDDFDNSAWLLFRALKKQSSQELVYSDEYSSVRQSSQELVYTDEYSSVRQSPQESVYTDEYSSVRQSPQELVYTDEYSSVRQSPHELTHTDEYSSVRQESTIERTCRPRETLQYSTCNPEYYLFLFTCQASTQIIVYVLFRSHLLWILWHLYLLLWTTLIMEKLNLANCVQSWGINYRYYGSCIEVKSSVARSLPGENLLPQNVESIISYLQYWSSPIGNSWLQSTTISYGQWRQRR